jgi:YD repeat-containing protein
MAPLAACTVLITLILLNTATAATFSYDSLGRIMQVVEADGAIVQYTYDANGNIATITSSGSTVPTPVSISVFSPGGGPVGTTVAVTGTGFLPTPSQNVLSIGGVAATVSAATVTQLTAVVPVGAVTGPIAITNSNGTATSGSPFTVSTLTVTSFTPVIGSPGSAVSITGAGFDVTPANDAIAFNVTAAVATTAASAQLQTLVPTGATSGRITVTTAAGSVSSAADFIVPPTGTAASSVVVQGRLVSNNTGRIYTINAVNKVAVALFDGVVGQSVTVNFTNVSMGGTYIVYAPDGSQFATGYIANGTALDLPAFTQTGTFSLYLRPGSAVGTATLRVVSEVTGTLNIGGIVLPVALAAGQNASFTFAGAAGTAYSMSIANYTSVISGSYTSAKILNPDGSTFKDCSSYTASSGTPCDFTLTANGTYRVRLDPYGVYDAAFSLMFSQNFSAALVAAVPTTVNFATAGQHASLTFVATAGQTLALRFDTLALVPSNASASVFIYRPDGSILVTGSASNSLGYTFNLTALPAGTYTARVTPSFNATGTLQARLTTGVTGVLPTDGTTVNVSTPLAGQEARYAFTGTAGQSLSFAITALVLTPNFTSALSYAVYRPDGGYMTGNACYTTQVPGCSVSLRNLPLSGAYTLVLSPYSQSSVTLKLNLTLDATATLALDMPLALSLCVPGTNALLNFPATAGQTVAVALGAFVGVPSNSQATAIIYNPAGVGIDSVSASANTAGTTNLQNLNAGTYSVLVASNSAATCNVQLTLSSGVTGSLPADGSSTAVATSTPGQYAYYTFAANAGQNLSLALTNLVTATSPYNYVNVLVLRPDGGSLPAINCYATSTPGCQMTLRNLPLTGTYQVRIAPAGQTTMSLSLRLSQDVTGTLSPGVPVLLNLSVPGQNALLNFTATAGQNVTLTSSSFVTVPASAPVQITVYNAAGGVVASGTPSAPVTMTNLPAGTYTVLVVPYTAATATLTIGT